MRKYVLTSIVLLPLLLSFFARGAELVGGSASAVLGVLERRQAGRVPISGWTSPT